MLRGGKKGPALVPGQPERSLMLLRIHAEEMPPRERLIEAMVKPIEPAEIEKLARWVALGAPAAPPNLEGEELAGTNADPLVEAKDRKFWSFVVPRAVAPPAVRNEAQVRNPIDRFLLARLEAQGLSLAPEADRPTLLRRATYDLTGLPPEPADVEVFLNDESPDAYERLIERLLASPRYGEKWGRHWLDVAGYADCEGKREQHLPRPFAWRYRDYVIRSVSADKPYDEFLVEQLAGDELVDYQHAAEITQAIEDKLVATGFLRMAPDPTWANLTGFVPDRLEVIADAIDVLGSGVMGLTFKCARCHSHKFDPIPQRDYYRLTAVFKGALDEHDWLKPEVRAFGGAVSAGAGERYLPHVTEAERRRWQAERGRIERGLETLKAGPKSAEADKRIKELEARWPVEPRVMALWDRGEPSPTFVYRRGEYQHPGARVSPGVPAALTGGASASLHPAPPWPGATATGRRLAFARWLTRPEHPLTARVMVNRVWRQHFGQGLVRSLGNFGKTGDPPTHPELLDWLAVEFVSQGWSIKALHRLMMTSSAYRQSSTVSSDQAQIDPDNRLLSRMPLRRLTAEELRDSLLYLAGELDETRFGPPEPVRVLPDGLVQAGRRRSIYVEQLRKFPPSLLESFDLPTMNPNCIERSGSVVAPQALHLLNDAQVRQLAAQWARRTQDAVGDPPARQARWIYLSALGRPPAAEEEAAMRASWSELLAAWERELEAKGTPSRREAQVRAWGTICHTMMNSAQFLYVD